MNGATVINRMIVFILIIINASCTTSNIKKNDINPLLFLNYNQLSYISRAGMNKCFSKNNIYIEECKAYALSSPYTFKQLSDPDIMRKLNKLGNAEICKAFDLKIEKCKTKN